MTKSFEKTPILEALIMAAALILVERMLFPGSITGWNPSPLWAIVLLIAARYGSPAGLIGGGVAAAAHLWQLTQDGHSFQDILHRNPGLLIVPVLYLVVGLFLGESHERTERRSDYFRNLAEETSRALDTSEVKRLNLERGRIDLEKRIAGQTDTLRSVYDSLNHLNFAATEQELWDLLCDVTRREMRAEVCGVWRLSPSKLLSVTGAWQGNPPDIARMAVKRRGVVSSSDWAGSGRTDPPGADMAGLIADGRDNPIVMAVAGIGFGNLHRGSVIFFDLIVQRAALVLREIRRLEDLRRASISDPALGLASEKYLRNRIHEQALLARRHQNDLTLLGCAFRREPPRRLAERLDVALACSIQASVRGSDGVAYFPDQRLFVIMLPRTDAVGSKVVMGKINANLAQLDLKDDAGNSLTDLNWSLVPASERDEGKVYKALFDGLIGADRGGVE